MTTIDPSTDDQALQAMIDQAFLRMCTATTPKDGARETWQGSSRAMMRSIVKQIMFTAFCHRLIPAGVMKVSMRVLRLSQA